MPETIGKAKKTPKRDIQFPYSNPYLEHKCGQSDARMYFWYGLAYKTNTIALVRCFLSSVLSETGVGAI